MAALATASAAESEIPGHAGETRKVLDRAIERYRTLDSYRDRLVLKMDVDIEVEGTEEPGHPAPAEISLAFSRPGRIALKSSVYTVQSDGRQLWQRLAPIEQYLVLPSPEKLDLEELALADYEPFDQLRHPIAFVLTADEVTPVTLLGDLTSFTGVKPEELGGQPGRVVSGTVKFWKGPGQFEEVPFNAWFSDKTGLLGTIRYDHTRRAQQAYSVASVKVRKYHQVMQFESVEVDAQIPDEHFVFEPGPYDEKVASYRIPREDELQQKLVGRPAPAFEGKDLEGKLISLDDLKGRVVLLDFWATWCGPCIVAMPHIQKLATQYADQPVTVLGVNSDGPSANGMVSRFLKQRSFTYRQIMDTGIIFDSYRSQSIPYLVLIDRQGIIRLVERGFHSEQPALVARKIDELLKEEPKPDTLPAAAPPARAEAPAAGGTD